MSVDNYWEPEIRTDEVLSLVLGIGCSTPAQGFHGSAYDDLMEEVLGEEEGFLYADTLSKGEVRALAERLANAKATDEVLRKHNVSRREWDDLKKMFALAGQQGCELKAWD